MYIEMGFQWVACQLILGKKNMKNVYRNGFSVSSPKRTKYNGFSYLVRMMRSPKAKAEAT